MSPKFQEYDDLLRSIVHVRAITNNNFEASNPAWIQATLPVKHGDLGFRSAVQFAPSAYLASAAGTSNPTLANTVG